MSSRKITSKMLSLMSKQSLKASRMRNTFVMITIILASALLTAVLMFAAGQKQQIKNELAHRHQVVYHQLTDDQLEILKSDERISSQIQMKTGILSEMDGFDVMPYYVNEMSDEIEIGEVVSGRLPESDDEVAVQAALLEKMGAEPAVGSRVSFTFYDGSTESFTVSGILKGSNATNRYSAFFSQGYAQNGRQLKDRPYEVYAKLLYAESMSEWECREQMIQIGTDAGIERKNVYPSKAFLDTLSVDMQSVLLYGLVGAVILLASVLVIYGVFYLSVIGRIHQFGQLCAMGMTKKQLKKFVFHEGGSLYLRAAPIGVILGGIAGFFMQPDGFHIFNALWIAVLVLTAVYIITMFSVYKPARLAASVSPMEALRYVPSDGMKKAANKKMCRKLTPIGLGMMNFTKNQKKAALTAASLALGGILFMVSAVYIASFNKADFARQGYFTDAEFHISYSQSAIALSENGMSGLQAEKPLGQELVQEISSLDGVIGVKEIKSLGVSFDYPKNDEYNDDGSDERIYPLTEEELEEISGYIEEGSADSDKLMSGDYILVAGNSTAEEIYGWKFETGDTITLHYYDGSRMAEKEVIILGILNQQYVLDHEGLLEGWFLMPQQAVLKWLSYENINAHLLVSTESEKEEEVGEKLAEMVSVQDHLDLETLAERRIVYAQNADQIFAAVSGLAIFIMMFSILSMMNTLITNIVTRRQELAMLESIGMDERQMKSMILGESLLLVFGAIGVTMTIGTLCGYALSRLLYRMGAFYMAFRFPVLYALAYAAVLIIVPLVITFASLRSFSKEALVERLRGMEN